MWQFGRLEPLINLNSESSLAVGTSGKGREMDTRICSYQTTRFILNGVPFIRGPQKSDARQKSEEIYDASMNNIIDLAVVEFEEDSGRTWFTLGLETFAVVHLCWIRCL